MSILDRFAASVRPRLAQFFTDHRGLVVVGVALPASYVFDKIRAARDIVYANYFATPLKHDERVRHVQAQVRDYLASGSTKPMVTARPEWATVSSRTATYKRDCSRIEVDLHDILSIDEERGTVTVEPLVNMGQLSRYLIPRGYALKTMVEMEDLTAGGLSMGLGMETMCHRFGLWQETVRSFEIVTADGERRLVTKDSDPELFHALPWSHGTIGFLVSVELELVKVKPYVRLEYRPCHSLASFRDELDALAAADDPPDFLEGTIYSRQSGVIQCGTFDDAPADPSRINRIGRANAPWYFEHVGSALDRGTFTEWIPLRDYYHRHTKSLFWEIRELIPFGNHPVYRNLLGFLGAPKVSLLKRTMTEAVRQKLVFKHAVQDLLVPLRDLDRAVELSHQHVDTYPLLVYPIRIHDRGPLQGFIRAPKRLRPGTNWDMYVDLGIYGIPAAVKQKKDWDAVASIRALEALCRELGGFTLLWADIFMTRSEFEAMFDHRLYRRMRERFGATKAFPEVWDKVKPQYSLSARTAAETQSPSAHAEDRAGDGSPAPERSVRDSMRVEKETVRPGRRSSAA